MSDSKNKEDPDKTPVVGEMGGVQGEGEKSEPTAGESLMGMIREVLAACPGLIRYGGDLKEPEKTPAAAIAMEAVRRAAKRVGEMRARIDEAQGISQETAVRYLATAAAGYLLSELPEGSDERKMYDAGIVVGKYLAERWQKRIERELAEQAKKTVS